MKHEFVCLDKKFLNKIQMQGSSQEAEIGKISVRGQPRG
jgi:hypothetical protein